MITRGDIFYVRDTGQSVGSEQAGSRPAIIVSNDIGNEHAPVVEVVYLTGMRKKKLPTHVRIYSAPYTSTALCEQVDTVDKSRLDRWIGHVSVKEQEEINKALAVSLGLEAVG